MLEYLIMAYIHPSDNLIQVMLQKNIFTGEFYCHTGNEMICRVTKHRRMGTSN